MAANPPVQGKYCSISEAETAGLLFLMLSSCNTINSVQIVFKVNISKYAVRLPIKRSEALISRCVTFVLFPLDLPVFTFTSCFILTIICVHLILIGFQNKNRVAILAELDKEKRRLQSQSVNNPGAR